MPRKARFHKEFGLSTTPQPEIIRPNDIPVYNNPPIWAVLFSDGTQIQSTQASWDSFSTPTEVDGVTLSISQKTLNELVLYLDNGNAQPIVLTPPVPTQMFAYTRWMGTPGTSSWMYSMYGYLLNDTYRVLLQVGSSGTNAMVQDRTTPFPL
jgi:hypothetical protein